MPLRKCIRCGLEANTEEELELFTTHPTAKYRKRNLCRKCNAEDKRKVRNRYKKQRAKWNRNRRLKVKVRFIKMLGSECEMCGESEPITLQFHHINPIDKNRRYYWSNVSEFKKLINEGKIRLLCSNCHFKLEHVDTNEKLKGFY